VWNTRDASYAVCNELRCGGRAVDERPLKVRFGEGYDNNDIVAFLKTVRETATRYPDSRPIVVFRALSQAAVKRLNSRVSEAKPEVFELSVKGDELKIVGSLSVTAIADAARATFPVKVDVSMKRSGQAITKEQVNTTVNETAARFTKTKVATVSDLGVQIYMDLRKLAPSGSSSQATIYVGDAGDFQIVLEAEPNRSSRPGKQTVSRADERKPITVQ